MLQQIKKDGKKIDHHVSNQESQKMWREIKKISSPCTLKSTMVESILNTICDQRRKDVAVAKETVDYPFSFTDRKPDGRVVNRIFQLILIAAGN